jgi:hypothetical protein
VWHIGNNARAKKAKRHEAEARGAKLLAANCV